MHRAKRSVLCSLTKLKSYKRSLFALKNIKVARLGPRVSLSPCIAVSPPIGTRLRNWIGKQFIQSINQSVCFRNELIKQRWRDRRDGAAAIQTEDDFHRPVDISHHNRLRNGSRIYEQARPVASKPIPNLYIHCELGESTAAAVTAPPPPCSGLVLPHTRPPPIHTR